MRAVCGAVRQRPKRTPKSYPRHAFTTIVDTRLYRKLKSYQRSLEKRLGKRISLSETVRRALMAATRRVQ